MAVTPSTREEALVSCRQEIEQWQQLFSDNIVQRNSYRKQIKALQQEIAQLQNTESVSPDGEQHIAFFTIRVTELRQQVNITTVLEKELLSLFRDNMAKQMPYDVQIVMEKAATHVSPTTGADHVRFYINWQLAEIKAVEEQHRQAWGKQFAGGTTIHELPALLQGPRHTDQ